MESIHFLSALYSIMHRVMLLLRIGEPGETQVFGQKRLFQSRALNKGLVGTDTENRSQCKAPCSTVCCTSTLNAIRSLFDIPAVPAFLVNKSPCLEPSPVICGMAAMTCCGTNFQRIQIIFGRWRFGLLRSKDSEGRSPSVGNLQRLHRLVPVNYHPVHLMMALCSRSQSESRKRQ